MMRAAALLLAATLAAPLPAAAQTASGSTTVTPARKALSLELARLINPEEQLMAVLTVAFGDGLPDMLLSDPAMKELEAQYPGIVKALADEARPILLRHLRKSIPVLWADLAVVYSDLSEADLRAVIGFYSSPTGQRIIELMTTGADISGMLESVMTDDDGVTSTAELGANVQKASVAAVARLTPAQLRESAVFAQTPAGRRFLALRPRMNAVMTDFSNRPMPEAEAEMQDVMTKVFERFSGKKLK